MPYFPIFVGSSASSYRAARLEQLTGLLIASFCEGRAETVPLIVSELSSLTWSSGGAVSVGRAWLALERGDAAEAESFGASVIRAGAPGLATAAMTRAILAACAARRGDAQQAEEHLARALGQLAAPLTEQVVRAFVARHTPPPAPAPGAPAAGVVHSGPMSLETIPNARPQLATRVSITNPFAQLCPASGEPQPSSTLTVSYRAGALLLETKALRRYLGSFAGENPYGVRDLEEAAQVIAQACADALGAEVVVTARYALASGSMEVEVTAGPSAPE